MSSINMSKSSEMARQESGKKEGWVKEEKEGRKRKFFQREEYFFFLFFFNLQPFCSPAFPWYPEAKHPTHMYVPAHTHTHWHETCQLHENIIFFTKFNHPYFYLISIHPTHRYITNTPVIICRLIDPLLQRPPRSIPQDWFSVCVCVSVK